MKSLILALFFVPMVAFATTDVRNNTQPQNQQQNQIQVQAQAQGQTQNQNQSLNTNQVVEDKSRTGDVIYAPTSNVSKNTPSIALGSLYPTSPCMGTSQMAGSGPGFSIGVGTSWTDDECGIRETARAFLGFGLHNDGVSVLCTSKYASAAPVCKKAE